MHNHRPLGLTAAALALFGTIGVGAAIADWSPETTEPIRLAMNEWTGQHVSTAVPGEILKRMGYEVEYVPAGYYPQLNAMVDGDIDATMEIWSSNSGEAFDAAMATGNIQTLGRSGLIAQEAWYVPAYVVDQCPGLPDYAALFDCAELFATPETLPDARLLDYPAEWGDFNQGRIASLELPVVSVPAGTEGAMIAEIVSAVEREAPLLVQFWEPHWLHAEVDLQRVYLPEYFDGCYDDPALGINPEMAFDCDHPPAEIWKVVNKDLQQTHPAAWRLIEIYGITNQEQAEMMAEIDHKGRDLMEVVNEWLDAHPDKVQAWIDYARM